MKINRCLLTFKGATLNINSFSDAHGQLENIGDFFNLIEENKQDLFINDTPSTKNVTAIAGDWYMAGDVKGYLSKPEYNSQKFQLIFFNKLIEEIKQFCPNVETIFSLGNHEFDAGYDEFANCIQKMNAKILATNIDFENSEKHLKDYICKSYMIEIPDDKKPNLKHKALFLGVAPANMPYYNKKLRKIIFLDNVFKPQAELNPQDVENTLNCVKNEIKQFKKENPKGAVILLDHFGGVFQQELLNQKLPINIILSAHEHYDFEKHVNNTHILMLYQNFKKLQNVKLKFNDEGEICSIQTHSYYPKKSQKINPMKTFFEHIFKKDIEKSYEIPAADDVEELKLKDIRYQNNYLANYITDVILNRIRKKYPQTDFFALNASAIRGPLKTKNGGYTNNLNLLLTLNGIKEKEARIVISNVKGEEILDIVIENLIANNESKNKNPLLHYSGLKIEKTAILECIKNNTPKKDLIKFIRRTDTNEPLELNENYTLANVEKFFIKSKNPAVIKIYKSKDTIKTELNAKKEFIAHFTENIDEVKASKEIRII